MEQLTTVTLKRHPVTSPALTLELQAGNALIMAARDLISTGREMKGQPRIFATPSQILIMFRTQPVTPRPPMPDGTPRPLEFRWRTRNSDFRAALDGMWDVLRDKSTSDRRAYRTAANDVLASPAASPAARLAAHELREFV